MLKRERGLDADAIARLADGAGYAPPPLTDAERAEACRGRPCRRAAACARRLSGMARSASRQACSATSGPRRARRSPPARRSICASTRSKASARRRRRSSPISAPEPTRWSPNGLRIRLAADAKSPAIHAEPAFIKGLVEIQDEGSQLAALLAGAKPGEQVLDLCAGGGGKTLGAGGGDGEQGPDLRHRRRQAPARADPRPARARRRPQRPGAHAEIGRHRARRSRGPHRPGADRRALHRHRRLAAQSGRQMAGAARRARGARKGAGRGARTAPRRW